MNMSAAMLCESARPATPVAPATNRNAPGFPRTQPITPHAASGSQTNAMCSPNAWRTIMSTRWYGGSI